MVKKNESDLTVSNWFKDYLLLFLSKIIEYTFRLILMCLPLCIYMLILQLRSKASSVSNISVYTNDKSAWQFVFPNFMLVSVNPKALKDTYEKRKKELEKFLGSNKYIIVVLFLCVLFLMLLKLK